MNQIGGRNKTISIFASIFALEGVAALIYLLRIPGDVQNAWLLGLSKTRFALATMLLAGIAVFVLVAFTFWRKPETLTPLQSLAQRGEFYYPTVFFFLLGGVIAGHLLWLSGTLTDEFLHGVLTRLVPLIAWGGVMSWQFIFILPVLRYEDRQVWSDGQKRVFRWSAGIFGVLLLLWGMIAATGLGIKPDAFAWDPPGAPLVSIQIAIAGLLGMFIFFAEWSLSNQKSELLTRFFDILLSLVLFLAAFYLWRNVPLDRAFYAPMERPPNAELYPYSDAAMYDSGAHRVLVGEGFSGIDRKPFYVLFLVFAHAVVGDSYNAIVNLQILFLAMLPVMVYWLTKSLHWRFTGTIAALLFILQEKNAIALSADIRVSNSKLMMPDMFAAFGVVLLSWLVMRWLQNPERWRWFPLLAGGVFGITVMIRSNSIFLLPVVLGAIAVAFYRKWRAAIAPAGLFALGLMLVIFPWMWRSYQLTGQFTLNEPAQVVFHAELYTEEIGQIEFTRLPGETEKQYVARANAYMRDFTLSHPGVVVDFVLAHFLNNELGLLFTLPLTPWYLQDPNMVAFNAKTGDLQRLWEDCCTVNQYVAQMPFWSGWNGHLPPIMVAMLGANLALIAIGLGAAWAQYGIVGLIPLVMSLAYSLSTAVARRSGWRFVTPIHWVEFVYLAIGIAQVTIWLFEYLSSVNSSDWIEESVQPVKSNYRSAWKLNMAIGIILLSFGISPLMVENLIPQHYAALSTSERVALLEEMNFFEEFPALDEPTLQQSLEKDEIVILQGRALYPRYYETGFGESGEGWSAYIPRDFPRLGFTLVGPNDAQIILLHETSPDYFPNATDVTLIGCEADDVVYALAVYVHDKREQLYTASAEIEALCPVFR